MARLIDAFTAEVDRRGGQNIPRSVGGAMSRFGWSTADVARIMGVSQRTARRWRQQDRVPETKRDRWNQAKRDEARSRARDRLERGGLRGLTVTGTYTISRSRYRATSGAPVRLAEQRISGAQMRDVFAALDRGADDEADEMLNQALAEGYGAPGLHMEDVESLTFNY